MLKQAVRLLKLAVLYIFFKDSSWYSAYIKSGCLSGCGSGCIVLERSSSARCQLICSAREGYRFYARPWILIGAESASMLVPNWVILLLSKRWAQLIVRVGECFSPKQSQLITMYSWTSRKRPCNQRVGCLLCSMAKIYDLWDGSVYKRKVPGLVPWCGQAIELKHRNYP